MNEAAPRQIEGYVEKLDEKRSVFVGQVPGESDVYMKFVNGDMETNVRITWEACKTLRDLLNSTSDRGLMSLSTWVLAAEETQGPPSDAILAG